MKSKVHIPAKLPAGVTVVPGKRKYANDPLVLKKVALANEALRRVGLLKDPERK